MSAARPSPASCLRCQGRLERGFLVDHGDMQVRIEAGWASGEPRRGFWRVDAIAKGERWLPIASFRCTRCGLLENYAAEG